MTDRSKCVRENAGVSSPIITNIGAPQGTVMCPVLLNLYTNDCRAISSDVFNVKFAKDTVIDGLITEDETEFRGCVDELVNGLQAKYHEN